MLLDSVIVLVILLASAVLWRPSLRHWPVWRAMVTPLASIIGSGFLVLGPLLNHAYGAWAPLAMAGLCAAAWGFGVAIRDNMAVIGDELDAGEGLWAEGVASALLGFAYMISVAYYLNLFGAFALSLTPWTDPFSARLLTSAVYLLILGVGMTKGFALLETMEYASVALKLAIIAGLLVALMVHFSGMAVTGSLITAPARVTGWAALTLLFGMIVTVQGFETSRYLGHAYDAPTRIRSMRLAQIVSTGIYLVYITLIAFTFAPDPAHLSETAIVDMMAQVSPVLPLFLVAAALAAQFSAAVADTSGSGGLIAELSRNRITPRRAYAVTVALGLAITWAADVFQIISYASRAFAAYYAVQAGIAAVRVWPRRKGRAVVHAALAVLAAAVVIFGTPVA
ncbi:MAG: hypothetical protein H6899_10525 [Rhodobacter sp.]|nr:hypothetical protein [Rhodobacter sp.]